MRYVDCTVTPAEGYFHPGARIIAAQPTVTREAVLHVTALGDGTGVLLYRLQGPVSALGDALAKSADVLAQAVHEGSSEECHLYLHVRLGEPAEALLTHVQRSALILVPPLACTERGGLGLTLIGPHDRLWQALDDVPADLQLAIDQVGEYSPTPSLSALPAPLGSLLTERQTAVWQTAIDTGYYEYPRQTTHADIATDCGCPPSTIKDHLRTIEARVFPTLIP